MLGPVKLGESVAIALTSETISRLVREAMQTAEVQETLFHLNCIREDSHYQKEYLKKLYDEAPVHKIDTVLVVQEQPVWNKLELKGRRHNLLLVTNATNVIFNILGVGQMAYTLQPGWTQLDLPDGTEIATATGVGNVNMIYRLTDVYQVLT
jgi:hypothetical protein